MLNTDVSAQTRMESRTASLSTNDNSFLVLVGGTNDEINQIEHHLETNQIHNPDSRIIALHDADDLNSKETLTKLKSQEPINNIGVLNLSKEEVPKEPNILKNIYKNMAKFIKETRKGETQFFLASKLKESIINPIVTSLIKEEVAIPPYTKQLINVKLGV